MTDAELDRLAELSVKASRGPWKWDHCGIFAPVDEHTDRWIIIEWPRDTSHRHDDELICSSRNALDPLIAEVRRLRAESAAFRGLLSEASDLLVAHHEASYQRGGPSRFTCELCLPRGCDPYHTIFTRIEDALKEKP